MNLLPKLPAALLQQWIDDAVSAEIVLPTVGCLASAHLPSGRVSSRMVNAKPVDGHLLIFSDFHESRKARDFQSNSRAAFTFYWSQLDRCIRIEGSMKFMSQAASEPFFNKRQKDYKASVLLGAQSSPIENRQSLLAKFHKLMEIPDSDLTIPSYWCGAELIPDWFEFYQGSPDRISDRVTYTLDGDWQMQRVSP